MNLRDKRGGGEEVRSEGFGDGRGFQGIPLRSIGRRVQMGGGGGWGRLCKRFQGVKNSTSGEASPLQDAETAMRPGGWHHHKGGVSLVGGPGAASGGAEPRRRGCEQVHRGVEAASLPTAVADKALWRTCLACRGREGWKRRRCWRRWWGGVSGRSWDTTGRRRRRRTLQLSWVFISCNDKSDESCRSAWVELYRFECSAVTFLHHFYA